MRTLIHLFSKIIFITLLLPVPRLAAMESRGDSSGLFGWKSAAAGVTVLVGIYLYWAYAHREKPAKKPKKAQKLAQKPGVEVKAQPTGPEKLNKPASQGDELNLDDANLTPEFFAREKARLDKEIADLERAMAEEEKAKAEAAKHPK